VNCRTNWGECRVCFLDDDGHFVSIPSGWTDLEPIDPFSALSAGRAAFRYQDLLALAQLIEVLRSGTTCKEGESVK
jgi:Family of unknown function (DUF5372)